MAIQGHDILNAVKLAQRIETSKNGVPVVTTDEIATYISGTALNPQYTSLTTKLASFASTTHTHAASAITSGTIDIARIPTGSSSTTVALGNHTHSDYAKKSDIPTISVSAETSTSGNVVTGLSCSGNVIKYSLGNVTVPTITTRTVNTSSVGVTSSNQSFTIVSDVSFSNNEIIVTKKTISLQDIYNTITSYHNGGTDVPNPVDPEISLFNVSTQGSTTPIYEIAYLSHYVVNVNSPVPYKLQISAANGQPAYFMSNGGNVYSVNKSASDKTVVLYTTYFDTDTTCTITLTTNATSEYNAVTKQYTLDYKAPKQEPQIINYSIVGASTVSASGSTNLSLMANNFPISASAGVVTWSSSNSAVATVSDGTVYAHGTASSSASSTDVTISALLNNNVVATHKITVTRLNADITVSPSTTTINVVDGKVSGKDYYTLTATSTNGITPIHASLPTNSTLTYYVNSTNKYSIDVTSGDNIIVKFTDAAKTASSGSANLTLSQSASTVYNAAANKVITFNFSKSTPSTNYYWYLGSSDSAVNDGDNPTALNTNYAGWHSVTSMPVWDNQLGSAIGVDAAQNDYTWLIMPTEWFNKLTVKTAIGSSVTWAYTWHVTHNGVEYTVAWQKATANLLYFTLK